MQLNEYKRMLDSLVGAFIIRACPLCNEEVRATCDFYNRINQDLSHCDKHEALRIAITELNNSITADLRHGRKPRDIEAA